MTDIELLKQEVAILKTDFRSVKEFQEQVLEEIREIRDKLEERQVNNGVQNTLLDQHTVHLEKLEKKMEEIEENINDLKLDLERRDRRFTKWIITTILVFLSTIGGMISLIVR